MITGDDKIIKNVKLSYCNDEIVPIKLYAIRYETIIIFSMKPSNLKRHFESKHEEYTIL